MRNRRISAALAATGLATVATLTAAGGAHAGVRHELDKVRDATKKYHHVSNAGPAYKKFLPCMDSKAGGMGQHYVNSKAVGNPTERARHPEALVYQVNKTGLKLVAVEYIVPASMVKPHHLPSLFGHTFHKVNIPGAGKLYVLHAWIWKHNPSGMFKDYNPSVPACPGGSMEY